MVAFALLLFEGRGTTFYLDEWVWMTERRTPTVDAYLLPHVGHLSVIPVALFQLMFATFGIHYTGYRVVVALTHLVLVALVFALLRQNLPPVVAFAGAVVLLFFGAGWQVPLWPFTVTLLLSLIGGLAAFLLIDRRSRWGDAAAAVACAVALGSSALGIPFVVGVGLEIGLRREWRRLWVPGVPGLLFLGWLVTWGERAGRGDGVVGSTRWAVEWVGNTLGALVGLDTGFAEALVVPMVGLFAWGIVRADRSRRPRVVAFVAVTVLTFVGTASSRAGFQPSWGSRYLYVGAVLVVVTAGECLAGVRFGRVGLVAVLLVAAWALVFNLGQFADGRSELLAYSRARIVQVTAIDLATRTLDPAYKAVQPPHLIDGDAYASAFDAIGSPSIGARGIRREIDIFRRQADDHLVATIGLPLGVPTAPSGAPPVQTRGDPGTADGACLTFSPTGNGVDVEVRSGSPRLVLESVDGAAVDAAPVGVRVRAFADRYFSDRPVAVLRTGGSADFPTPAIAGPAWKVGLRSAGPVRVCSASA